MCKSSSGGALAPQPVSSSSHASLRSSATTNTTSSLASGRRHTAASTSTSSSSSRSSLAAARASLPDPPLLYPFQELAAATNGFLSKRVSGSTYWRCSLRARHAALFQLRARPDLDASAALATVAKYHHASLARLLGACLAGAHVYLAYEIPPGAATLDACLRGPRANPAFTILRTWLSRVQVAADVAQGLDYVHNHAADVHGRVSPSTVLISDPGLRARLTHFGAAHFAAADDAELAGAPSREADVYAFGVLLLELLSGEEAARYRFDRGTKEFARVSLVETAAEAVRKGRVRSWVDKRLGDSFPVAAAERLVEVGLRCATAEPPEMAWVAGKVSKVYVESRAWEEKLRMPTEFSVSVAPR